jgi:plasmid stability protein
MEAGMVHLSVRNLSDETHLALKQRAKANGRSLSAEVRGILLDALYHTGHVKIGTYLFERSREFGGVDLNIERDRSPIEPAKFD